jgi:hypothetical protein
VESPLSPEELKTMFGVDDATAQDALDILRPFEHFVSIKIEGHEVKLPAGNSLWRGMQFWGMMTGEIRIDFSLFCIAGTCKNCKSRIQRPGDERPTPVLVCQTIAEPGIDIVRLAHGFKFRPRESRPPVA